MQKDVGIVITSDTTLGDTWEQLRMREPERISFHTARETALMVAGQLDCEIAICRSLPGARQSFQNLPLEVARLNNRLIIATVQANTEDYGPFFDKDLSFTSSDQEIVDSVASRLKSANPTLKMAAMTDLSRIIKYMSFENIQESSYAEIIKIAADTILSDTNTGSANHASLVFAACPAATRLFAEQFTKFLDDKSHPNYNSAIEHALSFALQNCHLH